MFRKITFILISLILLAEIPVDESEFKFDDLEIKTFAFVENANGIQLYSKAGDIESKTAVMRYQDDFELYGDYGKEVKNQIWRKIKFQGKDYFIFELEGYMEFEKSDTEKYGLVQEKGVTLYEKPFKDAKTIGKLDQFSIVKTNGLHRLGVNFLPSAESELTLNQLSTWHSVTISKQITGFILNGIGEASDLESIEDAKSKRALNLKGFCELSKKTKTFFSDEKLNKTVDARSKKILQSERFLATNYSFEKNKVRYYHIHKTIYKKKNKEELANKKKANIKRKIPMFIRKYNAEDFEAYISEKDCHYFTESEYSDYTVTHSNFSGDMNAIYAVKKVYEENFLFLDFTNFILRPLNPNHSKSISYFIALIPSKDLDSHLKYNNAILLAKKNGVYEAVSNSLYPNLDIIDIDKDGTFEVIIRAPLRGDTSDNNLFVLHKGGYVSINSLLPKNENFYYFEENEIHTERSIYNKSGEFETTESIKYKYQKGKLIQIK